jgi:DNA polymerase-4
MYDAIKFPSKGAVKITVNVSNFTMHHTKTLSLLDYDEDVKEKELSKKIHHREKFGLDILKTGDEL